MKELQVCPVTGRLLPADLAGYQCVVDGSVEIDDLLVEKSTREKQWAIGHRDAGDEIANFITTYFDVYRKIPCPRAGDLDKGWKEVASEASIEEAKTDDEGKPPLAELPWAALEEVSRVQAFGFKKYQDFHNYRKGMKVSRHLSCAVRHIAKWMMGEDNDKESGCSHLAHAACRILFVLQNIAEGTAKDNRYKPKSK